jgi:hypothetical protein
MEDVDEQTVSQSQTLSSAELASNNWRSGE